MLILEVLCVEADACDCAEDLADRFERTDREEDDDDLCMLAVYTSRSASDKYNRCE